MLKVQKINNGKTEYKEIYPEDAKVFYAEGWEPCKDIPVTEVKVEKPAEVKEEIKYVPHKKGHKRA